VYVQLNSTYPDTGYPDRFGPSGKFEENYIKLTCFEITGYRIKYRTELWLLELRISHARKVSTQVAFTLFTGHAVPSGE
jgi:hypothetical protein